MKRRLCNPFAIPTAHLAPFDRHKEGLDELVADQLAERLLHNLHVRAVSATPRPAAAFARGGLVCHCGGEKERWGWQTNTASAPAAVPGPCSPVQSSGTH